MSFFNLYAKTVRDRSLGSPALRTDITDGFVGFSLSGENHSTKYETTYSECVGCLVVDDSIWEVYESKSGDPVLCHRESQRAYNAITDFVVTKRGDIFSIELVREGNIESNKCTIGFAINEERNLRAVNITNFATNDYFATND
jgi:hypothetical protein